MKLILTTLFKIQNSSLNVVRLPYMKKQKIKDPKLVSMTALYMKRGYKRPRGHANTFMCGYEAAKKKL